MVLYLFGDDIGILRGKAWIKCLEASIYLGCDGGSFFLEKQDGVEVNKGRSVIGDKDMIVWKDTCADDCWHKVNGDEDVVDPLFAPSICGWWWGGSVLKAKWVAEAASCE
jgi:hypothetical protein